MFEEMLDILFSNNMILLSDTHECDIINKIECMDQHSTGNVILESISNFPIVINVADIQHLIKSEPTSEYIMNIFVAKQNQFYQEHHVKRVVISSYHSRNLKVADLEETRRILHNIDAHMFENDQFVLEFLVFNVI